MRAVVFSSPGEVTVTDVPDPVLQADTDALVQVGLAGICGTDLHAISGHLTGVHPGTVLGHEFVGTVLETGNDGGRGNYVAVYSPEADRTYVYLHLHAAAGIFHHTLDHVQADAGALDVVVEALEHGKELGLVDGLEPQAIVVHLQHRNACSDVGPHVDVGRAMRGAVLEGVAQEIVDHTPQILLGEEHRREVRDVDAHAGARALNQRG